jgi:hypothetical protein
MSSIPKTVEVFLDIMKNDPFPDYVETTALYTHWGGDGVKAYTIYNIKEGKADEGLKEITRRMVNFSSVEGYKIESEVVLPIEEALAILGKEMP